MELSEFISQYRTYPVLFVGSGFSKRYLQDMPDWNGLLQSIATELWEDDRIYIDIKDEYRGEGGAFNYKKIGSHIDQEFTRILKEENPTRFEAVNRSWYDEQRNGGVASRLKLYIASRFQEKVNHKIQDEKLNRELSLFRKAKDKFSSIITTNYDTLLEELTGFNPLIGNDILLSNPLQAIYKIHGCVKSPKDIILTEEDYTSFDERYELIRAQLISLFIHNPIIFIGYGIGDENIQKVLRTIFSYVSYDSELGKNVASNFLLVEYDKGNEKTIIEDINFQLRDNSYIAIKKVKTDNYSVLYQSLSLLDLPVSIIDQKRIRNIIRGIEEGGAIKVHIEKDWDNISTADRIIAIGSLSKISLIEMYDKNEIITYYFDIIEQRNVSALSVLPTIHINKTEFFPVFGFSTLTSEVVFLEIGKEQQINKLKETLSKIEFGVNNSHTSVESILTDNSIAKSYKNKAILKAVATRQIPLQEVKRYYQRINWENLSQIEKTDARKLICLYDIMEYAPDEFEQHILPLLTDATSLPFYHLGD
ncbi:SIR2 family protein [Tannerella forsythia]|nr:SIR2 family protein [Tannerella forsythia]